MTRRLGMAALLFVLACSAAGCVGPGLEPPNRNAGANDVPKHTEDAGTIGSGSSDNGGGNFGAAGASVPVAGDDGDAGLDEDAGTTR